MRDHELEKIVDKLLEVFREERKKQSLTYTAIAEKTGLHHSTISLLENKKRTPTVLVALKIAKALNLDLSDILKKTIS